MPLLEQFQYQSEKPYSGTIYTFNAYLQQLMFLLGSYHSNPTIYSNDWTKT
jgi:hypothetical protein